MATWRTSSTAISRCRPDAVVRTHQAGQARPGSGRARKVPAATLLHVGHADATLLIDTIARPDLDGPRSSCRRAAAGAMSSPPPNSRARRSQTGRSGSCPTRPDPARAQRAQI